MKYGDETYQIFLKEAKIEPRYKLEEALLAAEAECERLRFDLIKCECQSLRIPLEEYRARYGKLNQVEQEETK